MQAGFYQRLARSNFAGDSLADATLSFQRDESGLGVVPIKLFQRRLYGSKLFLSSLFSMTNARLTIDPRKEAVGRLAADQ
jgi:hypothetical protein